MDDRVVINVSGMTFETKVATLNRFPNTLLGSPALRSQYYNPEVQEYFFNRHRAVFESILFYYQSGGRLVWPEDIPVSVFTEEVEFFQLGDQALNGVVKCLYSKRNRRSVAQCSFQRQVWNLFEHPDTSNCARMIAMFSILMIAVSVVISCVETLPYFRSVTCANETSTCRNETARSNMANETVPCNWSHQAQQDECAYKTPEELIVIETICYSWFLLEFLVRFFAAPDRCHFLLSPLNFVDLLAIVPFFTILVGGNRGLVSLAVLRAIRLLRIFRILKLTRYSRGLQVIIFTVRESLKELEMMVLFMFMICILASSAVFYSDLENPKSFFTSIPDAFWWSLTTVSTVGYGDYYPVTDFGKIVGCVCAVFGVLAFSLPVMAFATNFNAYLKGEPIRKHIENNRKSAMMRKTGELSSS